MKESRMTQVGVAWKKKTRNDKVFISLVLPNPTGPDIHLTMWANSFKQKDGQPDYIIYKSGEERPASTAPAAERTETSDAFPPADDDPEIPF